MPLALLFFALAAAFTPAESDSASGRAWTMLKQGLSDEKPITRTKAVHALGVAGLSTQDLAEKALADVDKQVRAEAATALLHMNATTARLKLRECLKDKEVQVVLSCANALYEFKDPIAYDVYYAVLTGQQRSHEGLVQSQLDTLHDPKQLEKLAFETGIGFVPFAGPTWQAIKTIKHDDATPVRVLAVQRLTNDSSPATTKEFVQLIADSKYQVRDAVVIAMAKRDDPDLINILETRLFDDNDTVRYDAAGAIIALTTRHEKKSILRRK